MTLVFPPKKSDSSMRRFFYIEFRSKIQINELINKLN